MHICFRCPVCRGTCSLLPLQTCQTHTWKQWVLYAEHGWPVSVRHDLHDLLFGYVCASIFDTNPSFQVVEMAPVQLKELDQQYAQIFVGVSGINSRMELRNKNKNTLLKYLILNNKIINNNLK